MDVEIDIADELVEITKLYAVPELRTVPEQIEYWARI
jgi:hypothetical protein